MCWKRIKSLFRPLSKGETPLRKEVAKKLTPRKWWQFPYRVIKTSIGGPHMPKFQCCPRCYSKSKRQSKTMGGAHYRCRSHGEFFVKGK